MQAAFAVAAFGIGQAPELFMSDPGVKNLPCVHAPRDRDKVKRRLDVAWASLVARRQQNAMKRGCANHAEVRELVVPFP